MRPSAGAARWTAGAWPGPYLPMRVEIEPAATFSAWILERLEMARRQARAAVKRLSTMTPDISWATRLRHAAEYLLVRL